MKKLLQSKAGVGCLCLVAVFCIVGNFVDFSPRKPFPVAARAPDSQPALDETIGLDVPPALRPNPDLQAWRKLLPLASLGRDPFMAAGAAPLSVPVIGGDPLVPEFTLQAVSINPGHSFAVINNHVLAEGEALGESRLERITPVEVWMRGPHGLVLVSIKQTARPADKKPIGIPVPTDLPMGSSVTPPALIPR